jgi:sugar-phosphatase
VSAPRPQLRLPFDAAVFDLDGLLVDSEPLWHEAEIRIFGRYGVPLTADRCRETKGMFVGEVTRHWYARYPWDGPAPEAVAGEIVEVMAELLVTRATLKPGALHAMEFCRAKRLHLALASSSPRRLIDVALGSLGLSTSFAVVHSAEQESAGKPDPAVFLSTAAMLGVAAARCVVFEDSPAGVRAATAAGMGCIAVPEDRAMGRTGAEPDAFDTADAVIGSLEELDQRVWRRLCSRRPEAVG